MRGLLSIILLACTLVHAAANDYVEARDVTLDAAGIRSLNIRTNAGPLRVTGDAGARSIAATATITVPGATAEEAAEKIEKDVKFSLLRDGDEADLTSLVDHGMFSWGDDLRVELDVVVPLSLGVSIEDGSGSAEVTGVGGPLSVDDGSGSIKVHDSGSDVTIEDGSGGIEVIQAAGDVRVIDGSGAIRIEGVGGSVVVDDGSGSINVRDVAMDFIVRDSGSGGVNYSDVRGRVEIDE